MGKKPNPKSKEKRLARKEEQIRIALAKASIDRANKLTDPLEPFPIFRKYTKNNVDCSFFIKRVGDVDEAIKEWAFNLTKKNMQHKYENCSWGWSDTKKYEELMDESAWYLIAMSSDDLPIGFSHFRFDLDEGMEVLYCYELQLEHFVHRKGLGKFMMQILELIAFTNQMRKVVLTVLKHNSYSSFFKAINYQLDETSPEDDEDETYPYEILSKINRKLAPSNPLPPMTSVNNKNHLNNHSNMNQHHCCPGHHH